MKKILAVLMTAILLFSLFTVCAESVEDALNARFARDTIEYNGTVYARRNRLTTILLMGIDKRENTGTVFNRGGGQSDFLVLIVVDDANRTITPIQLNRDTMTDVSIIDMSGRIIGTRYEQITLQHAFGDGKELSCKLTRDTVSALLLNAPIDLYYSMNMDGINALNDAVGGVTVTIPDDMDMTVKDPEFLPGATVTLTGNQAEKFVRSRRGVGEGKNTERLERQRIYLSALQEILVGRVRSNPNFAVTIFEALEPYVVTDMGRGLIINLANKAQEYEILPMLQIEGTQSVNPSTNYNEFYLDEDSLTQVVIAAFYEEE